MNILLSTSYLAPIQYYSKLFSDDDIWIEQYENYQKQSYRNRCSILSANGVLDLNIPIESSGGKKNLIKDICIADHGNWRHLHWNALISAYNSTPFFEYYVDDFIPFYEKTYKYLFDFNEELRLMICDLLSIDCGKIKYTDAYISATGLDLNGFIDFRTDLSPKKNFKEIDRSFEPIKYYQVFDNRFGFCENLSIVDLLFNMGNESLIVLKDSYNYKKGSR